MKSEARVQQELRLSAAKQGGALWRNNVGAVPTKAVHTCPRCSLKFEIKQPPIRYGLANDSSKLNKKIKSSDLIGITRGGIFTAVEAKPEGWVYTGTERERAQLAWISLVNRLGGRAFFSTGEQI